jgi:hypothetical protein
MQKETFQDKVNNMPPVNLVLSNGSLFEQKKEKFRHLAVKPMNKQDPLMRL